MHYFITQQPVETLLQRALSVQSFDSSLAAAAEEDDLCIICFERRSDIALPCAHMFCSGCMDQWHGSCPLCRTPWVVYGTMLLSLIAARIEQSRPTITGT